MSQYTQSELDEVETEALKNTELVGIGGFSTHDGFTEESDDSTETDCTQPTNMFSMSDRALRHQERSRTQEENEKLSQQQFQMKKRKDDDKERDVEMDNDSVNSADSVDSAGFFWVLVLHRLKKTYVNRFLALDLAYYKYILLSIGPQSSSYYFRVSSLSELPSK